jgi:RNA polymerase sigma-70 factor (ECF subfamily)
MMEPHRPGDRLSQLSTSWTILMRAHDAQAAEDEVRAARRQLIERYELVIRRYLMGALRSWPNREELVEECFQNFAFRFVSGAFRNVSPERGRFRDYLKITLSNLVTNHRRARARQGRPLGEIEPAVEEPPSAQSDQEFLLAWREGLLSRALEALAEFERKTGQMLYTVLRFRMDHPDMRSPDMAAGLGEKLGKTVTPVWVRKRLFLARAKFAELVLKEVVQALDEPTDEQVEDELVELGLLEHCRSALEARRGGH